MQDTKKQVVQQGQTPAMYSGTNYSTTDNYLINSPVRNTIVADHQQRGSAMPFNLPAKLAARSRYDDDLGIDDDETGYVDTDYDEPYDRPVKSKSRRASTFIDDYEDRPMPRSRRRPVPPAPRSRRYQPMPTRRRPMPPRRTKLSSLNSVVLNSYPNLGIYKYANPQQQSGFGFKPQPGMLTGGSTGLKNPAANPMHGPVSNYLHNMNTPPVKPSGNSGSPSTNFVPSQQPRTPVPTANATFMPPNLGKQMVNGMMGHYNEQGLTNARSAIGHAAEKYNLSPLNFMPGVEFQNLGPLNSLQVNPVASMNTGAQNFQNFKNIDQSHNFQNPYSVAPNENYTGVSVSGTF